MADVEVRSIRDGERLDFLRVQLTAMLHATALPEEDDGARPDMDDLDRCLVAVEGGSICGSASSWATRVTVPGGSVPAAAVTRVGVLPTHRRRGHLSRMMATQLGDARDRGEAVAVLVAAEWPIYGRYGYGPATQACVTRFDADAARFVGPPAGSASLVPPDDFAEALAEVYPRAVARHPGHLDVDPAYFGIWAGAQPGRDGQDDTRRDAFRVVWADDDGVARAVARYTVAQNWVGNRPRGVLTASLMAAATDEAEGQLYRYLASVDWVGSVEAYLRPVDDPLSLRLADGRVATTDDVSDHVWLRVLDVPAALSGRSYATVGSLVVEVVDPQGLTSGRFALDAGPDGATCAPTDRRADLTVPTSTLGAAYLGGHSWARLGAAGLVDEHVPGAIDRAAALFATSRAPYCSMTF